MALSVVLTFGHFPISLRVGFVGGWLALALDAGVEECNLCAKAPRLARGHVEGRRKSQRTPHGRAELRGRSSWDACAGIGCLRDDPCCERGNLADQLAFADVGAGKYVTWRDISPPCAAQICALAAGWGFSRSSLTARQKSAVLLRRDLWPDLGVARSRRIAGFACDLTP